MRTFKGTQAVRNPSRKTLHRLIAALALLTAVVVGFSLTVFAYFTDSLVNAGNTIASGRFSADLMVAADENGDTPLYTRAGVLNADAEVILDGYAGQTVYVRVAAGADSTVAFQLRLTAEAGGRTLLAVPGTGDNPVLEPGSQTLTYAVEVPADGRMTLRLDTAFCAAVLTGVPTTTTTTTTVATITATDPSPADNALKTNPRPRRIAAQRRRPREKTRLRAVRRLLEDRRPPLRIQQVPRTARLIPRCRPGWKVLSCPHLRNKTRTAAVPLAVFAAVQMPYGGVFLPSVCINGRMPARIRKKEGDSHVQA